MEVYAPQLKLRFGRQFSRVGLIVDFDGETYGIVEDSKYRHDAINLFEMGKELMGKSPKTLITDGLKAYQSAFLEVYATNPKTAIHIRDTGLGKKIHNNKMERFNGEIRDREKVMRGLKSKDTSLLKGYQIFHNYIRPHEALKGKTPSEACGVEVKGDNKWITIIQNAKKGKIVWGVKLG